MVALKTGAQTIGERGAKFPWHEWYSVLVALIAVDFCPGMGMPSTSELSSLPEPTAAANFVTSLVDVAVPVPDVPTLKSRTVLVAIEAGFAVGMTTAVHELGHARRVRAVGGHSSWETGDVNWWSYLEHRDPLKAGATNWLIPWSTGVDQQISILAGGFNATTQWDEEAEGHGPLGLVTARFSTLLYEFAGVRTGDDDLSQIETMYREKGYKISRREMQLTQIFAGVFTQLGGPVKVYTYYTPKGVSLRARVSRNGWNVATEAVVHGTSDFELEVGRSLLVRKGFMLKPALMLSPHGAGGALKADMKMGRFSVSFSLQQLNRESLLASRNTTNYNIQITMPL